MRTLLCAMVIVAVCPTAWARPAQMLTNGSFETLDDAGLPEGWRLTPEGAASMEVGDAPDGERWLRMVKPEGAHHTLAFQRLTVEPNTGYRLRAYLRAPRPSYYSLIAYDAVMNTLASKATGWAVLEDWVELELDFRTRATDTVVNIGLLGWGLEAHWDAVRIWEDDSVRIGDLSPAVNEPAQPTRVERERGFMVFGRKANDFVGARYAPTRWDCFTPIRGFCPPGEFETIVVGIHALRDLTGVRAQLRMFEGPLPGAATPPAIDAELLQVGHGRRALNSQAYMRYPLLLLPPHEVDVAAGDTLQYAVRVRVPDGYAHRRRLLAVELWSEGAPTSIQVIVDVPQVRLDRADATFFMYYSDSYLPEEMATAPMQAAYYRDMATHGMNSVSLYVVPERETEGGYAIDLHHDWRYPASDPRHALGMAARIAQMRAAGLAGRERPLILISGGGGLYNWGDFRDPGSVRALMRLGGALGWPPLLFYMHDEPNLPERVEAVRQTYKRIYARIPEARTVTAIGEYGIEQVGDLYDVRIAGLADIDRELVERARSQGKELWAYDCRQRGQRPEFDRFVCGLWAWAAGVRGVGQWAYYAEEALERTGGGGWEVPQNFDGWYMMPSEVGPISTVGWEARREGVEDYRALCTLERLAAGRDDEAATRGRQLLARARTMAPVNAFANGPRDRRYIWEYEFAPDASARAMSDLRLEMLDVIEQLQE